MRCTRVVPNRAGHSARGYAKAMEDPIYLAGPLGFTEAGRFFHEHVLLPGAAALGLKVLDPWPAAGRVFGGVAADKLDLQTANSLVGRQNAEMIRASGCLLAILDGSDVDSGTAAEIGYAAALGKPIAGVRSDLRMSGDNLATAINLQVAHFVQLSGGSMFSSAADALKWIAQLR